MTINNNNVQPKTSIQEICPNNYVWNKSIFLNNNNSRKTQISKKNDFNTTSNKNDSMNINKDSSNNGESLLLALQNTNNNINNLVNKLNDYITVQYQMNTSQAQANNLLLEILLELNDDKNAKNQKEYGKKLTGNEKNNKYILLLKINKSL